jgi:deoxyribonuclease IV
MPAKSKTASTAVEPLVVVQPKKGDKIRIGAHTSISGGVSESIPRAVALGFTAAQIFVKNNKQWFAPELKPEEVELFRRRRDEADLVVFGHNSYLVNPGSPKPDVFDTSVKSLIAELERADALGLPFLVMHPGAHGGAGEEEGLKRVVEGLNQVTRVTPKVKTRLAIENTAGQGSCLGAKFEHLAYLLNHVAEPQRFGVCLDTAHLLESGYDIRDAKSYEATFREFEKVIGVSWLLGWHLNDSKTPLGSRVDRHEHLGEGHVGMETFRLLMQDKRWRHLPKVLETPKSEDMHEDVESLKKIYPFIN